MRTAVIALIIVCLGLTFLGVESRKHGRGPTEGKIIGGEFTDIQKAKYQVSIHLNGSHICSGVLISATYILTAAHCLIEEQPEILHVRIGSTSQLSGGIVREVENITLHKHFNSTTYDFDLGLAKLKTPVSANGNFRIVRLSREEPQEGQSVLVTSWGAQNESHKAPSENLQFAVMPVVDKNICRKNYALLEPPMTVTHNMFCAGHMKGGVGTCNGDSGAPAVMGNKLAGVVIGGAGCGYPEYPGLYNVVKNSIGWIKKHVKDLPK